MNAQIKWTPEMDIQLAVLAKTLSDRGVANRMCMSQETVRMRRNKLNIPPVRQRASPAPTLKPTAKITFPRFEDVTATEARHISADAPVSAPFRKQNIQRSMYGSSMAEMCG
jgi:hypothetical protein